jgi:2-dehydro-3-deoxyphosphogluconate aldolase/(4S)-4-hydroxy-2-oxoglutarate aldolase
MMNSELIQKLSEQGIIAVLVIEDLEHTLPLVQALCDGGVKAVELTLRTPVALEAAKLIKKQMPDMVLGIGTVLTLAQVEQVASIGVDFAVAPGCNPKIINAAAKCGLPFAPGVATPTDMEIALENGCKVMKFFPAEQMGGLKYLEHATMPYRHLDVSFFPLGGLRAENAGAYLASPLITAIGGSWIAKSDMIRSGHWEKITANAKEAMAIVKQARE